MKLAIIGANGKQGSLLLEEALKRNIDVTAIVRRAKTIDAGIPVIEKDIMSLTFEDLSPFDVIIDAFGVWSEQNLSMHQTTLEHLTKLLENKPQRLLIVGGAGSLYADNTKKVKLMNTEEFPKNFLPLAQNMAVAYDFLQTHETVNWTYVSPSENFIVDGEQTGTYQVGTDVLLKNAQGISEISYADYAIAMIDEAIAANHIKERITVCSK